MPAIKIGGRSATKKPAAKPSTTRKPAAKKTAAKPAAKKTTATKAGAKSAPKAAPKKAAAPRPPRTPKIDPKIVSSFEKRLKAAGAKRAKTLEAHDAAVDEMATVVQEAMKAEVPMSIISNSTGVSRQWLYKISQFKGRNGAPAKTPGKTTRAAAKPAAKRTTTTKAAAKPAAKSTTTRTKRTAIKIK